MARDGKRVISGEKVRRIDDVMSMASIQPSMERKRISLWATMRCDLPLGYMSTG